MTRCDADRGVVLAYLIASFHGCGESKTGRELSSFGGG